MIGSLQVQLVRGEKLRKRDMFSSDPYCFLSIDGEQQQRSSIVHSNLNPIWNEEFRFNIYRVSLVSMLFKCVQYFFLSFQLMGNSFLMVQGM